MLFEKYAFKDDTYQRNIIESFPVEIINHLKIKILNESHAGAVYYFDDYKKVSIGIISENETITEKPLLSPIYYIKKSLDDSHSVINTIKNIFNEKKSIIFFLLKRYFQK